ncbi:hypothetical protein KY285_022043 [Solanum tuberosum]|nr:hypothetical protein KY285_022043 [Solanum tuberosum]
MEDISSFMESLPTDFLTVLRTDGLLRSLMSKLGAPLRVRLLAYAEYALYGLSLKADSKSDSDIGVVLFRFKIGLRYIQLRLLFGILGLVSWLENIKHMSTRRFTDFLASAGFVKEQELEWLKIPGILLLASSMMSFNPGSSVEMEVHGFLRSVIIGGLINKALLAWADEKQKCFCTMGGEVFCSCAAMGMG